MEIKYVMKEKTQTTETIKWKSITLFYFFQRRPTLNFYMYDYYKKMLGSESHYVNEGHYDH